MVHEFSEYACNHQQSALHERRTSCDRAEIVYELVNRWWVNLTRTPLGNAPHELLYYMIFWHRLKEEPNNGMRYGTILFLPDWPSTGINLSYVSKFSFPYLILSHDRDSPISPFLWSHILVERTKKEGWWVGLGYTFWSRYLRSLLADLCYLFYSWHIRVGIRVSWAAYLAVSAT